MPDQSRQRPPTIREALVEHFTKGPGRETRARALDELKRPPPPKRQIPSAGRRGER